MFKLSSILDCNSYICFSIKRIRNPGPFVPRSVCSIPRGREHIQPDAGYDFILSVWFVR